MQSRNSRQDVARAREVRGALSTRRTRYFTASLLPAVAAVSALALVGCSTVEQAGEATLESDLSLAPNTLTPITCAARQSAAAADPFGYTRNDGVTAVLHRDASNNIREIFLTNATTGWRNRNLTAITGAPPAAGKLAAYVRTDCVNDVLFRSADGHVWTLSLPFGSTTWIANDLTLLTGVSAAAGDPVGIVRRDGINMIVFRGTDSHIQSLHLDAAGHWIANDLTNITNAALAVGDPTAYVRSDAVTSVNFRGTDNHIKELSLGVTGWIANDLTNIHGATLAASDPVGFRRSDGGNDILYRGVDNDVYSLHLDFAAGWTPFNLNFIVTGPSPFATGRVTANVRSDRISAVNFRGTDNHIYEFHLEPSVGWLSADLTAVAGGPLAASDPWGYIRGDNLNEVVYKGTDGHVQALTLFAGTTWTPFDLTLISHESL